MLRVLSFFILFSMFFQSAFALDASVLSVVGAHEPIFTVEKNHNPQNIMVLYTKLNEDCSFQKKSNEPILDFYWLMDKKNYKPIHALIKRSIRNRMKKVLTSDPMQFAIVLTDLSLVKSDIKDPKVSVVSKKAPNGKCVVDALMTLGPAQQNVQILLKTLYTEAKMGLFPSLVSVTLRGAYIRTGQAMSVTYKAK